jgi:hypothetical protein
MSGVSLCRIAAPEYDCVGPVLYLAQGCSGQPLLLDAYDGRPVADRGCGVKNCSYLFRQEYALLGSLA